MSQSIFTLVLPVLYGRQGALKRLLESYQYLGRAPDNDPLHFTSLETLHFASLFLYDDPKDGWSLVMEFNIDGGIYPFQSLLAAYALPPENALHHVLQHCEGFDAGSAALIGDYFAAYTQEPSAGYHGSTGRGRDQIIFEAELHRFVSDTLNQLPSNLSAEDAAKAVRTAIAEDSRFYGFDKIPAETPDKADLLAAQTAVSASVEPRNVFKQLWGGVMLLVNTLVQAYRAEGVLGPLRFMWATLLFLVLGVWNQLRKEPSAPVDHYRPDEALVSSQKAKEDFLPTNHMVSVVHLHHDSSRHYAKWAALELLKYLARYQFNKGVLGTIPTIHFAHWAMLNQGRRLMFVSNFDGSWGSYLDDFTLKAAVGLTLAWAHGKGFPTSVFMLLGGAAKGPEFIDWARRSMVPNLVWYKAYPELSIRNINYNSVIRQAIAEDTEATNKGNWLELIQ